MSASDTIVAPAARPTPLALHLAVLLFGAFACSTAVIFIKLSTVPAVTLSALRCLVAVAILAPLFWRDWRRHRATFGRRELLASVVPGLLLGLHFIAWIVGARLTSSVNASLIVNLIPIVMPFILFLLVRERLTRWELAATVVTLVGLGVLSVADFRLSRDYLVGDLICLVSMVLAALYLALGRRNRALPSLWLYVVPLYLVAGVFCLGVAFACEEQPLRPYPGSEWLWILALGVIPTVLGHTCLNYAMKHLRGQVVSLVNMSQFVFAGILAYFCFREIPDRSFYAASLFLIAGSAMAARPRPD